ncbi:alpha/beta fold hydrolase [Longispora albida]|uniref:alpha/beta fold hydrolase n=1 Tax=Longispora albida TaxID=203523 RepID=UPI00035C6A00|nr:alpha/beta fold hydrolase [Longispora albida]
MNVTEQTLEVWGGRLSVRVKTAGSGPPLLYFHQSAGLAIDPFVSHLAEKYTVYAPELPGTSAGDPYAIHAVDELSDLVLVYEEVARKLDISSAVLAGQSFGGMLACELAAAYPSLATKLVLLAPLGLWREDLPVTSWMTEAPEKLPGLFFHDPAGPIAQAALKLPEEPAQMVAAIAQRVWNNGCAGKFIWPIPDRGLRGRLHRITAPALVVWGKDDRIAPAGYAGEFSTLLSGSKVALVDECGHLPQVEKYKETAAAVDEFLA